MEKVLQQSIATKEVIAYALLQHIKARFDVDFIDRILQLGR
ncbi:hypothetical protein BVRB_8g196190 [Beta vulgaris subsp. vulgaris]|nr:hypothetical protein BVRB_8g196190 [Beta vulgaris subsp. vulgaris]